MKNTKKAHCSISIDPDTLRSVRLHAVSSCSNVSSWIETAVLMRLEGTPRTSSSTDTPDCGRQQVRNRAIRVPLSENELDILKSSAARAGMSMAQHVRALCVYGKTEIVSVDREELRGVRYELARVGNNLNQIARRLNAAPDGGVGRVAGELCGDARRCLAEVSGACRAAEAVMAAGRDGV